MHRTILIIGAGKLGRALATITAPSVRIIFWDKDPGKRTTPSLPIGAASADLIIYAAPAAALLECLIGCIHFCRPDTIFLSAAKGLDSLCRFPDEVLTSTLSEGQLFAILGGPMLAGELNRGTRTVLASDSQIVASRIHDFFDKKLLRTSQDFDVHGTAVAGVAKNVYALAAGISSCFAPDSNERATVLTRLISEMSALGLRFGAHLETVQGQAGMGDFLATALSPHSTNVKLATEWVRTGSSTIRSEGYLSLPILVAKLGSEIDSFPILKALHGIFYLGKDPGDAYVSWL